MFVIPVSTFTWVGAQSGSWPVPLSSLVPKGIYRGLRSVTLGDGVMCSGNHLEDVVSADSFLLSHFLNGIILNLSLCVLVEIAGTG